MNKKVRFAVMVRAAGRCEACGKPVSTEGLHADHFFGRAKAAESVETVWGLCLECDYKKTHNHPTSAWWCARFVEHCETHGYAVAAAEARLKLAWANDKATARRALQ